MIRLAGALDLASSPSVLTDASRRTPDREREPCNQAWTPPGACCLRCGGWLVLSDMASLESDLSGRPMRLWRCVNCGDCVDRDILANRGKALCRRAKPRTCVPTSFFRGLSRTVCSRSAGRRPTRPRSTPSPSRSAMSLCTSFLSRKEFPSWLTPIHYQQDRAPRQ